MKKTTVILVILSILAGGCGTKEKYLHKEKPQEHNGSSEKPSQKKLIENEGLSQKKLLNEHNKQRESRKIKPLVLDDTLNKYAQEHAETMAKTGRLYHSKIENISAKLVGENVAFGQETEELVLKSWMNSYGHRSNILSIKYKKVGFGRSTDKQGRIYWCAVFTN